MKMRLLSRSKAASRSCVLITRHFTCSSVEYDEVLHQYVKHRGWRLLNSHVFFRHGERTPISIIEKMDNDYFRSQTLRSAKLTSVPMYPYVLRRECEEYFERHVSRYKGKQWKVDVPNGEITILGHQNMHALGKKFRRRYVDLIRLVEEDTPVSSWYCRSTLRRRNIDSLRCFLSGFLRYSSAHHDKTEPVEMFTGMDGRDPFAANLNDRITRYLQTNSHVYEYYPEMDELRAELVKALGLCRISGSVDALIDELPLSYVHDDLISRVQHGIPLPRAIIDLIPNLSRYCTLEYCYRKMGVENDWHDFGLPFAIGPAFDIILKNVTAFINGSVGSPALRFYCTHDVFLIPFLVTTDVFDGRWPPFCSYIALEVYEAEDGQLWVQLHYNDQLMMELSYDDWKAHFEKFSTTVVEYQRLINNAVISAKVV